MPRSSLQANAALPAMADNGAMRSRRKRATLAEQARALLRDEQHDEMLRVTEEGVHRFPMDLSCDCYTAPPSYGRAPMMPRRSWRRRYRSTGTTDGGSSERRACCFTSASSRQCARTSTMRRRSSATTTRSARRSPRCEPSSLLRPAGCSRGNPAISHRQRELPPAPPSDTTTRRLVHGLERLGIPAFGPIWDS